MQKQVKIINMRADNFGIFQAVELDLQKFKNGVLAIKGHAGEGKSTVQKAIKISTQGRKSFVDADTYGDKWEIETQLIDGDRKIFVGAYKKEGKTDIEFKLFEKDAEGKKTFTPIIDGVKATPANYMNLISTELTFGIKEFLNENNTIHKKFMFALFRPELEKLGVIFDKANPQYEKTILGQLDALTATRDGLRNKCIHMGAFATDFKRDGLELDEIGAFERVNVQELNAKHTDLLVNKGKASGEASVEFERLRSAVAKKGQDIVEEVREKTTALMADYDKYAVKYDEFCIGKASDEVNINEIISRIENLECLDENNKNAEISIFKQFYTEYWAKNTVSQPIKPICPEIVNGRLTVVAGTAYFADFLPLIQRYNEVGQEYMSIKEPEVNSEAIEAEIAKVAGDIQAATQRNLLIDRYELNREWVEADAQVTIKRKELAQLYAQVNTGVPGLRMKPFFDDEKNTSDIKTVYTGEYDLDFFKPRLKTLTDPEEIKAETEREQLLIGFSSTQMPIIGVLLQVARLKLKEKVLPYIFIDDVPMDKASRAVLTDIAEKNGLIIITSITGDFDKDKLTENELLIEGGEVFFS